jgi:hypothetical protein
MPQRLPGETSMTEPLFTDDDATDPRLPQRARCGESVHDMTLTRSEHLQQTGTPTSGPLARQTGANGCKQGRVGSSS